MLIHHHSFNRRCTHWNSKDTWQSANDDPSVITCPECQQLYKRDVIVHEKGINCALRAARELRYGPIWEFVTRMPKSVTCEACKNQLRKTNIPMIETPSHIIDTNKTRHWLAITAKGSIKEIACTREIAYNLGSTKTISIAEQLDQVNCLGCLDYLVWLIASLKQRVKFTQETHKAWHASWVQMWANIGAAAQVWRPKPKVDNVMPQDEAVRKRFELLEID